MITVIINDIRTSVQSFILSNSYVTKKIDEAIAISVEQYSYPNKKMGRGSTKLTSGDAYLALESNCLYSFIYKAMKS